jgi:hypothetical protein
MTSNQWTGGDFNDMANAPGVGVASRDQNHIDIFYLKGDSHLYHKGFEFAKGNWNHKTSENLPKNKVTIQGIPAVTTQGPNLYDIFVWGTDQHLYHLAKNAQGTWLWDRITEGKISSIPTVVAVKKDRLDVFFRDSGGKVASTHWPAENGGWSGW